MPHLINRSRNEYLKVVVLHNGHTELRPPLNRDDVEGKFESSSRSPAVTGAEAGASVDAAKQPIRISCDGHLHPGRYDQKSQSLLRMIQMANENRIKYFVAMRIPTNVNSLQSDRRYVDMTSCGETYYLPQSLFDNDEPLSRAKVVEAKKQVELCMNTEVDWIQAAEYMKLTEDQKDRIDLAITGLYLGDPRAPFSLLQKIAGNEAPFSLVGEVTLAKEVVMHLLPHESQAHLKSHIKPFCTLAEIIGLTGMPISLHCDVDTSIQEDIRSGHPANLNGIMKLFSDTQLEETTIIWAHFGGISRFGSVPETHYSNLDSLLRRFPNLMIDLSWSRVASKLDPAQVAELINTHPDRFIMGSDALAPHDADVLGHTYTIYNEPGGLFSQLTEDALEKTLVTNYEKTIRAGREHCKKFKQHILPKIEDMLSDPAVDTIIPNELRRLMVETYKETDPDYFQQLSQKALQRSIARKDAIAYVEEMDSQNIKLLTPSSSERGHSPPYTATASRLRFYLDDADAPSRTATESLARRTLEHRREYPEQLQPSATAAAAGRTGRAARTGRPGRSWRAALTAAAARAMSAAPAALPAAHTGSSGKEKPPWLR